MSYCEPVSFLVSEPLSVVLFLLLYLIVVVPSFFVSVRLPPFELVRLNVFDEVLAFVIASS